MDVDQAKLKIAKLLALAQGAGTQGAESENAMRLANKLMAQFAVDASQCTTVDALESKALYIGDKVDEALGVIGVGVAVFTDTVVEYIHVDGGFGLSYFGESFDIEYAAWLFTYLRECMRKASGMIKPSARTDYRKAYAIQLQTRMRVLRKDRDGEVNTADPSGRALVALSDKLARIKSKKEQRTGTPASMPQDNKVNRKAQVDASAVQFNRPIASTASSIQIGS